MEMENRCRCTRCQNGVVPSLVTLVQLSFEDWPTILIAAGVAMVFGQLLLLSPLATAFFALLASLPLTVGIEQRTHCGADFHPQDAKKM